MSDCVEVIFASDNSDQIFSSRVWDPKNGSTLMSYKNGGGIAPRSLSLISTDYIISADSDKPLLHVWPLNSQEPTSDLKIVVNGKIKALAVSPNSLYCVGGIENNIFIWNISTGAFLKVVSKHYQDVTNIKFINDSFFVSSGEDGVVLVWKLSKLIQVNAGHIFQDSSQNEPFYNFSDHSLAITDIFVSTGGMKARLYTVSLDQTCKIYSLNDGKLLLSLVLPEALTSVVVNNIETIVYVGTTTGNIWQFCLEPMPRHLEYHATNTDLTNNFKQHTESVTCLSLSMDGLTLLSGSRDQSVIVWDLKTTQSLRVMHLTGPVTNAFFCITPNTIFQEKFKPNVLVKKFQRTVTADNIAVIKQNNSLNTENYEIVPEALVETKECFDTSVGDVSVEDEVKKLRDINKQLYLFAMNKILENPVAIGQRSNLNNSHILNGHGDEKMDTSSSVKKKRKRKRGYPSLHELEISDV